MLVGFALGVLRVLPLIRDHALSLADLAVAGLSQILEAATRLQKSKYLKRPLITTDVRPEKLV